MRSTWLYVLAVAFLTPILFLAPASALRSISDASASIGLSHQSMSFDIQPDGIGSADLTITNTGDAPLHYSISTEPVAGSMNVPSAMTSDATEVHAVDWSADHVPGRLIVGLKPGIAAAQMTGLHAQLGATVKHSFKLIPAQVVEVKKGSDLRKVAEAYAKNPQVAYAEPDYLLEWYGRPNDPSVPGGMFTIAADDAWDVTTGSHDVIVAVLDSGLEVTHPDLAANVWTNPAEIAGNGIDDDRNGYVDDLHGWNFWDHNPDLTDIFGHGTHCSGIVGAVGNNGIGVVGVNWKVKLLMTKWGNEHEGPASMMISCLQYAVSMGARVSSNSYGSSAYSQAAYDAIAAAGAAGHLFVAAAGNDGRNNDYSPTYPCSYDLDNIISVAASAMIYSASLTGFSNYGPTSVDLAAPGEGINSTFPPHTYKVWQGTSMACPHVAGAAALVLARNPELSPLQVKSRILNGADRFDTLAGKLVTGGRLNAYRSLGVPWLQATPTTGEIAPGESAVIRVDVNAKALLQGFSETCNLTITSDDPNQPSVSVPVTLSVNTHVWISYGAPLPNTEDTVGPYIVAPYMASVGVDESSLAIRWNTTGTGPFNEAPIVRVDTVSGLCRGEIPGQPAGTTVYYYIYARDTAGREATHPLTAPTSLHQFKVLSDATPPIIEHTPLTDAGSAGPYQVSARVTDDMGVGAVTLHWRKNGGAFTSAAMTKIGDTYVGSIPGGGTAGDVFCYYLSATDASARHNAGTHPAGAPDALNCFGVAPCGSDTLGESTSFGVTSSSGRGNIFRCTSGAFLTKIEQYLTIPSATELSICVYESATYDGIYSRVHLNTVSISEPGTAWFNSGPISVELVAGRYYIIGAAWQGEGRYHYLSTGHPVYTRFGESKAGCSLEGYPPAPTIPYAGESFIYTQRLTTCRGPRVVTMGEPNGGELLEPGDALQIRWSAGGTGWAPGDTVSLEYSDDAGQTWAAIPGAQNVPYESGSFDWDTTGVTGSTRYRVRVAYTGDPTVSDSSDGDFTISADTTPPRIEHTSLPDSANVVGPYRVIAYVTDDRGVGQVTMYWRRNGGEFAAVPMAAGGPQEYAAEIPGPSEPGDLYCYYIEAADASTAANVSRSPAGGSDQPHCFEITQCGVEEIGDKTQSGTITGCGKGNVYACTSDSVLTKIEHYLSIYTPGDLRFFVYESPTQDGTYALIHETEVPDLQSSVGWLGTGPISVEMVAGRYYIIGAAWQGYCRYYYGGTHSASTAFGRSIGGFDLSTQNPPDTTTNPNSAVLMNQRLSVCRIDRTLRLVAPNGGEAFEPDNKVQVSWVSRGRLWQPGQTVRLESSADGGATWGPVVGSESLPHDTPSFDWDTTGMSESSQYRIRVVYGEDASVNDGSDADFVIATDNTPPTISHTPLADTHLRTGPYKVCATVTDAHGVKAVTLHWKKSVGGVQALPMVPSGKPNEYCADIPGPGVVGTRYGYYIEARDVSYAENVSTFPSDAPAGMNSFVITACAADTIGSLGASTSGTKFVRGNAYACTDSMMLTQIEQYLSIATSAELRFAVYEALSSTGVYSKVHETTVPASGTGAKWYGSGPISVPLTAGRFYIFATGCAGLATFYNSTTGQPVDVNFGRSTNSYASNIYPPRATTMCQSNVSIYHQRLSTCALPRSLAQIKCSADGESAVVSEETVSAVFGDRFYVQKTDRSSGIGVLWSGAMPAVSERVGITGVTLTTDHERLIDAVSVDLKAVGAAPEVFAMTNYRVGGNDRCFSPGPPPVGQQGFVGAVGPNNIGLLVRTWGRITAIGDGFVYIDDGSRLRDGTSTGEDANVGLRVICDPSGYATGDYVIVTGISSCFATPSGGIARRLLTSRPEDIRRPD